MDTREDLRTELEAMIAAGRELSPDTDRFLAERFLDRLGTKTAPRKRRRPSDKPRSPGRTAKALLVAALALAIGTPISLHANQNYAPAQSYQAISPPSSCSWHTELMFFHSLKALLAFHEQASPKSYRLFHATRASNGEIAARVAYWRCS